MKSYSICTIFKLFYLLLLIVFSSCQSNDKLVEKVQRMEKNFKQYIENPARFIYSHNNKDNFIAVFSNFTRTDGENIYNEYLQTKHKKDIQSILDNINNFKFKNVNSWSFDSSKGKFVLPDDSKILNNIS